MNYALVEKRLQREKKARLAAEQLLENKSRELYEANQALIKSSISLESQSNELRAILDNTQAGIFLIDGQGLIKRANKASLILFDASESMLIGSLAADLLVTNDENDGFLRDIRTGAANGIIRRDISAQRGDGAHFPMELTIAGANIAEQPHSVWICRDLTTRLEAEQKRTQLERKLAQAQKLESLGVLASGIAHEINTPVQYVTDNVNFLNEATKDFSIAFNAYKDLCAALADKEGVSDILNSTLSVVEDTDLDYIFDELPGALSHTLEGLAQISKIVGAVKTFAHPGAQEKVPTDLNALISDTITIASNQWKYVAEVETDFQADLPPLACYPSELNQVFLNLIVNAAHAIEESGTHPGRIFIKTQMMDQSIEISVEDNGCGMDAETQAKIFDPFFTTKEVGKGTGQGLSFCYAIITQQHGGEIAVQSHKNKGARFIIKLPMI